MDIVLSDLEKLSSWKEVMRLSCKKNDLKASLANELTPLKLKSIQNRLLKSYENLGERVGYVWIENELKAYHWLLIAVSGIHNIQINLFDEPEWTLLESIFLHKSKTFLKFQAQKLISSKAKNKSWSCEENQLLRKIVTEHKQKSPQWNEIARRLFEQSNQTFFRSGKHCRQRWFNYLDPTKQRGQWTPEEDLFILRKVQHSGKKWSEYAQQLNRTEHTVKNRFNSMLIKQKKLTPNIKKEQKLIQLIIQRLSSLQVRRQEESQGEQKQVDQIADKQDQSLNKLKEIGNQAEQNIGDDKIVNDVVCEQRPVMSEAPVSIPLNGEADIMKYTRDQEDFNTFPSLNQFGIYSPYYNYSPIHNTPSNFMSSPSPLPFYINSNFANYGSRFAYQMQCWGAPQEDKNN